MGRWTDHRATTHADIFGKDHKLINEEDWMTCAHCYYGWKVAPGSGRTRGWCFECKGPLCMRGPDHCRECKFISDMKFYAAIRGNYAGIDWGKATIVKCQ